MGLVKALTKKDSVRNALCWLAANYIRLVFATGRWEVVGGDIPAALWDQGRPFILAFWHGRILMMPYCWRREQPINMLISQHRDGQIIAATVGHFGIRTVAGSSSKGGLAALRAMKKALKSGECVGITPDGPRGPRMRASDGIVQLARLSGVPILPCSFSVSRRKVLGSWDRFILALPFARGVFVWGRPITVPSDASAEQMAELRGAVEDGLNAVTRTADLGLGQSPIDPAALPIEAADGGDGLRGALR